MTLPSGYEAVYPRWHRCRQCQRPMLLLVLYYHCLQTAPLNISRALFFFIGCVELRLTEQWDGATVPLQGLAHTKHRTLFCFAHSYHTISSFFLRIEKKRESDCFLVRGYKNKKTGWRGAKENSYMSLIVKKKLAAGHGSLIRIVSKTNTATADMEICAVCAEVPTWQIPRPSPALERRA